MPTATFNNFRDGCYLGESDSLNMINEEIIIVSGAGVLKAGTILGKITASGKYNIHDPVLANGTELPAGAIILFGGVDATAADVKAAGTVRGSATINDNMLTYKAGMTSPQKKAVRDALRVKGMAVLPQHAGE